MAVDFMELLGAMAQGGMMSSAAGNRARNAAMSMGDMGDLQGLLGALLGGGQAAIGRAGRAVGGNDNLAAAGIGALLGALSGKQKGTGTMGGLGGGLMALLGMMAFKALKNAGQNVDASSGLMAGLMGQPAESTEPTAEDAKLIMLAMLNAAKADGQIEQKELDMIVGNMKESGLGSEGSSFIISQLQAPMATNDIVQAVRGRPDMAAQVYSASLMAIDVDTEAERRYLDNLARVMGLSQRVVQNIQQLAGMSMA